MQLFDSPPELLSLLFGHLLHSSGIRATALQRQCSRCFNQLMLDAIYSLPTFEASEDPAAHLRWHWSMHKTLVAGLIYAKLEILPNERSLTRDLLQAVNLTVDVFGESCGASYTNALARLAADELPLHEVVRGLTRTCNDRGYQLPCSVPIEGALVAAVVLGRPSQVKRLLDQGGQGRCRTKRFGDALIIAASASFETFGLILERVLRVRDQSNKQLINSRLIMALERDAAHGRADLFGLDLWSRHWVLLSDSSQVQVFEPALGSAVLASHNDVVHAIFKLLETYNVNLHATLNHCFWHELLRVAATNGSEFIARLILERSDLVTDIELPLEDACRSGHKHLVDVILAHHSRFNPMSCHGAMFWAGRTARYDIMGSIVRHACDDDLLCFIDALCGASIHGTAGFRAVIAAAGERAPSGVPDDLDNKTFAQLIGEIYGSEVMTHPGLPFATLENNTIIKQLSPADELRFFRACTNGQTPQTPHVARIVTLEGHEGLAAACPLVIREQKTGILQYLCDTLPEGKYFGLQVSHSVRSPAVFQVLLDEGWSVEARESREKPPILRADPNARCDWDITPLSIAIETGCLSTIKMALQHGGDTRKGQLLHFAMRRKSMDQLAVVDILLSFGANINDRMYEDDERSWKESRHLGMGTPSHQAAEEGKAETVAFLMDHGADVTVLDSLGRSALALAREGGHENLVEMIEARF